MLVAVVMKRVESKWKIFDNYWGAEELNLGVFGGALNANLKSSEGLRNCSVVFYSERVPPNAF